MPQNSIFPVIYTATIAQWADGRIQVQFNDVDSMYGDRLSIAYAMRVIASQLEDPRWSASKRMQNQ